MNEKIKNISIKIIKFIIISIYLKTMSLYSENKLLFKNFDLEWTITVIISLIVITINDYILTLIFYDKNNKLRDFNIYNVQTVLFLRDVTAIAISMFSNALFVYLILKKKLVNKKFIQIFMISSILNIIYSLFLKPIFDKHFNSVSGEFIEKFTKDSIIFFAIDFMQDANFNVNKKTYIFHIFSIFFRYINDIIFLLFQT